MAAAKRNIVIEKKSTFFKRDQYLNGRPTYGPLSTRAQIEQDILDGVLVPVDLTGATLYAKWQSGNSTGNFTAAIEPGTDGWYTFGLTDSQTAGLTWTNGSYDVRVVLLSGKSIRLREGSAKVEKGIA